MFFKVTKRSSRLKVWKFWIFFLFKLKPISCQGMSLFLGSLDPRLPNTQCVKRAFLVQKFNLMKTLRKKVTLNFSVKIDYFRRKKFQNIWIFALRLDRIEEVFNVQNPILDWKSRFLTEKWEKFKLVDKQYFDKDWIFEQKYVFWHSV